MHPGNGRSIRLGAGLAAIGAVLTLVAIAVLLGANSETPSASAGGPTPTPTKIANDGSLSGVVDILIHAGGATGIATCIGKVDHDAGTNLIKTALQCYNDLPGLVSGDIPPTWADVVCTDVCPNPDLQNPSEPGPDALAGPPPPPPYTAAAPSKAFGIYYPSGDQECVDNLPFWGPNDPCISLTVCFEDLNIEIGPNVIMKGHVGDPEDIGGFTVPNDVGGDGKSHGKVDIYYNQANSSCETGVPKGPPNRGDDSITTWDVYDKAGTPNASSPWRIANPNGSSDPTHDYDGDDCWDDDELDKSYVAPGSGVKCGDDPFNPTDSFDASTVDLTGIYTITSRLARWDCADPQNCTSTPLAGIYTTCLAELRHDTGDNSLTMRPYCYADQPAVQINQEAYPGITGDGIPGAPPPGPEAVLNGGNFAYGDVDSKHAELSGSFNPTTNAINVAGCFIDEDGLGGVGDVWFAIDVSAHQLPGTATINLFQNEDCAGSPPPIGSPITSVVTFVKETKGLTRDDDHDGVPTARELQDDVSCGLRDPFNKNDYYDVSIPRDGIIDLFNDIVGVINNYEPVGYTSGDAANVGLGTMDNYDRPAPMIGGVGPWNRGSPDLKIDLFNDIVGVIGQYNPTGC